MHSILKYHQPPKAVTQPCQPPSVCAIRCFAFPALWSLTVIMPNKHVWGSISISESAGCPARCYSEVFRSNKCHTERQKHVVLWMTWFSLIVFVYLVTRKRPTGINNNHNTDGKIKRMWNAPLLCHSDDKEVELCFQTVPLPVWLDARCHRGAIREGCINRRYISRVTKLWLEEIMQKTDVII